MKFVYFFLGFVLNLAWTLVGVESNCTMGLFWG